MSQEEIDKFCKLYQKTGIKLLPSAIDFFKKYGGSFRNAYIDLNQLEYKQDVFLDCFGIPYVRYKGENQKGKTQEQIVELECASSSIDDIKEFAKQEECPIARIGYYYPPYVYIGEDGTLYCEYEYKDEIGVFKTPAKILEYQFGNVYPVGVLKSKSE